MPSFLWRVICAFQLLEKRQFVLEVASQSAILDLIWHLRLLLAGVNLITESV